MKYKPVQNILKESLLTNSSSTRKLDVISPLDGNKPSEVPMSSCNRSDEVVSGPQKLSFPH